MTSPTTKSQRQRILDLLLGAKGQEVPSVALSRISLQYGARVKELRELGFRISNRTVRRAGKVHGYFHLELGNAPPLTAEPLPEPFQPPLLADTPQRWIDPEEGGRP